MGDDCYRFIVDKNGIVQIEKWNVRIDDRLQNICELEGPGRIHVWGRHNTHSVFLEGYSNDYAWTYSFSAGGNCGYGCTTRCHGGTNTQPDGDHLDHSLLALLAGIAWLSCRNQWLLVLALAVGGIGGLLHEIAQSRGKILFFRRQSDGLYIGAIAGVVLGAVAGILIIRGYVTGDPTTAQMHSAEVCYGVFLAGLALKGVAEAAGTGGTQE